MRSPSRNSAVPTPAPSGDAALHRKGVKKWSRRVHKAIAILRSLIHYDVLHIGGGNAPRLIDPPRDVRIGANTARLTGGIRLWEIPARAAPI